jgi:hypothetical protein
VEGALCKRPTTESPTECVLRISHGFDVDICFIVGAFFVALVEVCCCCDEILRLHVIAFCYSFY